MDFEKIVDTHEDVRNESFRTLLKEQIFQFLSTNTYGKKHEGDKVYLNDDLEICVDGNVIFKDGFVDNALPSFIQFRNVTGEFSMTNALNLTSLKGFPKTAWSVVIKDCPKLKSLDYLPEATSYELHHLGIRDLEGFPETKRYKGLNRRKSDERVIADLFGDCNLLEYPSLRLSLNNNLESLKGLPQNLNHLTILRCKKIRSIDCVTANVMTFTSDLYAVRDKDSYLQPKERIKSFEYINTDHFRSPRGNF